MFFVYEEGITMKVAVGGAVNLAAAQKMAESRAKSKLIWAKAKEGYEAVLNCGTYHITYTIRQQEER